ncbi:ribosomal L7Ae/L30e/S12e/Gadd45 family protein [Clostridium sp. Mt-5]|uniref:Ribosomal L7Ae/L30e/S12e/Gadd45 family protein n=2 Tax=Clostridium moutaii TaxID=3240932 RepID=A0ABV4BPR3_9CLOT
MTDKFLQFMGLTKRAGKLVEGYNICENIIKKNKLYFVIMSRDISKNTCKKFLNYSCSYNVPVIKTQYSKEQLGGAIGLKEINIIGISDNKMGKVLFELWKKNEKL